MAIFLIMKGLPFFGRSWKAAIVLAVAIVCGAGMAQAQVYTSTSSNVVFSSKAPMEDIEAVNKSASAALNTATGEVVAKVAISKFEFPNKLMQEHFNEKYMESTKYPFATFQGKFSQLPDLSKPGTYPVVAKGKLTVHGVEQPKDLPGTITVAAGGMTLDTQFAIPLADHKIERPSLMLMKISEKADVHAVFQMKAKQ